MEVTSPGDWLLVRLTIYELRNSIQKWDEHWNSFKTCNCEQIMLLRQSSAMEKKNACVKKAHASLFSFINLPSLKIKDYITVEAVNQHPKDQSCSVNSSIRNLPIILPTIKNNCKKKTKLYKPCRMEVCTSTILPRGRIMRLCQYNLMNKNPSNNLP